MRLRSFATFVVCAALAACDGDTILPADTPVGTWVSNRSGILATFPDGTRPVLGHVELTLRGNGEFRRVVRYTDPVEGLTFTDAAVEGTYTLQDGSARITITRAYFRLGGAPAASVTLQPVQPTTETYVYAMKDGRLTFSYTCGPLALCTPDPFPHYSRVAAE